MKNHDYEYVRTIVQEGNFSKAAQKLYISQPALSAAIKKIEKDLNGIPLFDRSVNPVKLTVEGEYWLERAREIDRIETQIREHFAAAAGIRSGTISVGSSAYFCAYLLANLIREYHHLNTSCEIDLTECDATSMDQGLRKGTLDVGIDVEQLDPDLFDSYNLGKEYLLLAVPASFPVNRKAARYQIWREQILDRSFLRDDVPGVDLGLFRKEPFVLLKKNQDSYRRAIALCEEAGFEPDVTLYLDQLLTAYSVARNGQTGCVFFRDTIVQYAEDTDKLCYYKLGSPLAARDIRLSVRKNPRPTRLVRNFIRFIQEKMQGIPGGENSCRGKEAQE